MTTTDLLLTTPPPPTDGTHEPSTRSRTPALRTDADAWPLSATDLLLAAREGYRLLREGAAPPGTFDAYCAVIIELPPEERYRVNERFAEYDPDPYGW